MNEFLFVIVPYLCLTIFVAGHLWRYRYDKFGWTTRSSQLYENRLLRIGSPLFHFGMLGVVGGHVIGLLVPQPRRRQPRQPPPPSRLGSDPMRTSPELRRRPGRPQRRIEVWPSGLTSTRHSTPTPADRASPAWSSLVAGIP
ncbi:respiratory nitrate reductase subunit gamma, partial [Kribbella koreensis]|uniref:respiratory nitrate reductase subunit gamma n=1 Tax=Kribbella koreensis TaxID=57909 RepID=UPI0031DA7A77